MGVRAVEGAGTDAVEDPGHSRAHLPRAHQGSTCLRGGRHSAGVYAGPLRGERGVENAGQVEHITLVVVEFGVRR